MLKLTIYPPGFTEPSGSPFCVKSMCMVAQIGREHEFDFQLDPRKAPKGKFPVLSHKGKTIADSDDIRAYLETEFGVDFDEGLSLEDRAKSRAIVRMIEEHTYFGILASRWQNDENWTYTKSKFFGSLPKPIKWFLPALVRKGTIKQVEAQGMGRHSEDQQLTRIAQDLEALEVLLGDQKFMLGDKPTGVDYSAVPMLRSLGDFPVETATTNLMKNRPKLLVYLDRSKEAIYPNG